MSRSRPLRKVEKVRRVACPPAEEGGCGAEPGKKCTSAAGGDRQSNHQARVKAHRNAYPPVPSIHAQGGPARDRYGREFGSVTGDTALPFGGDCAAHACDEPLHSIESSVKTSKGWMHRACAPGADDD